MLLRAKRQRFPGVSGEWNVVWARGGARRCVLKFESDAPGDRRVLIVDGGTGRIIRIMKKGGNRTCAKES